MKKITLLILLMISVSNCASQKIKRSDILDKLAYYLNKKGDLSDADYRRYKKTKHGVVFFRLFNGLDSVQMREGVYRFSISKAHHRDFFFIYDDNKIEILSVITINDLANSIAVFLTYADKKRFCVDVINKYISSFTYSHFVINNRGMIKKVRKCDKTKS